MNYFESNCLFAKSQHRFCRNRSCETTLHALRDNFYFFLLAIDLANILFADYTTPFIEGTDVTYLSNIWIENFKMISNRMDHNNLILNYDKTKFMFITHRRVSFPKLIQIHTCVVEVVESVELGENDASIDIDVVDNIKPPGITIDNKLMFNHYFKTKEEKYSLRLLLRSSTLSIQAPLPLTNCFISASEN